MALIASAPLANWTLPPRPPYLADLRGANNACACSTTFGACDNGANARTGGTCVNGLQYEPNRFLHVAAFGHVQERRLHGMSAHPYHQHVHPFQLVGGFNESEYFRNGDWHDTWQDASQSATAEMVMR